MAMKCIHLKPLVLLGLLILLPSDLPTGDSPDFHQFFSVHGSPWSRFIMLRALGIPPVANNTVYINRSKAFATLGTINTNMKQPTDFTEPINDHTRPTENRALDDTTRMVQGYGSRMQILTSLQGRTCGMPGRCRLPCIHRAYTAVDR